MSYRYQLMVVASLGVWAAMPVHAEISDAMAAGLASQPQRAEVSGATAASVTEIPVTGIAAAAGLLAVKQDHLVILQPVQLLLEQVTRQAGLRLKLTDGVKGVVRNLRATGTTDQVLDSIAATQGLDWFLFNGVVHVSSRTEVATRLIRLGDLSPAQALAALQETGLPAERIDTRTTSAGNALALSGPPELLALVEAVIESIPPQVAQARLETPRTVVERRGNEAQRVILRSLPATTQADQ
jgi:type III secretion protein C